MALRYYKLLLFLTLFIAPLLCLAEASPLIKIHTRLKEIGPLPSWLIIIYDLNSSAVYPYLYDLSEPENFFSYFYQCSAVSHSLCFTI